MASKSHLTKFGYVSLNFRKKTADSLMKEFRKFQKATGNNKKSPVLSEFQDLLMLLALNEKPPKLVKVSVLGKRIVIYDTAARLPVVVERTKTGGGGGVKASKDDPLYLEFAKAEHPAIFEDSPI